MHVVTAVLIILCMIIVVVSMLQKYLLFLIGHVSVHFIAFVAVFDIYFTTPVVQNVRPLELTSKPLARRLVLFVADGLRADKFFEPDEKGSSRIPFLKNLLTNQAVWGVSHTQAPTESRPAHVAILAGFFEDITSIKLLWKDNPVEFDTVLNRSRETWAWGAPDVLPFFNKGSASSHVHIHCHSYNEYPLHKLDVWVFDQVKNFFEKAKRDRELRDKLLQDKIVFFIHLAGIDSNGHRHDPPSRDYSDNIPIVDQGVRKIVKVFEDFYGNDKKTAFIFTADHGQTDAGSHGGSHPNETRVPVMAWGAGIRNVSDDKFHPYGKVLVLNEEEKRKTREWGLNETRRVDMTQIDLSVLMTALIGVPFPLNSRGVLPLQYLSSDGSTMAKVARGHARQMVEQLITKMEYVRKHVFHFIFLYSHGLDYHSITEKDMEIGDLIDREDYRNAIEKSGEFFKLSVQALDYFHTYHRTFIYFSVVSSLAGWMALTVIFVVEDFRMVKQKSVNHSSKSDDTKVKFATLFTTLFLLIMLIFYQSNWRYFAYCLMPLLIWHAVASSHHVVSASYKMLLSDNQMAKDLLGILLAGIIWTWLLILGLYNRKYLSIGLAVMSFMPYFTANSQKLTTRLTWMALCICVAIFPLLPETNGKDMASDKNIVLIAGIIASLFCSYLNFYQCENLKDAHTGRKQLRNLLNGVTILLPTICGLMVHQASSQPRLQQAGTIILALSWIAPVFSETKLIKRLISLYSWQLSSYILLSLTYDALFCVALCALLFAWIALEYNISSITEWQDNSLYNLEFSLIDRCRARETRKADVRRAFLFMFFLVLGFFGISSVESISKFSVRRLPFLPSYDPTSLIIALVYKLSLHYVIIACSFCGVVVVTKVCLHVHWCMVVVITDFMMIHFIFWVKEVGSWADITTSVVFYGIVAAFSTVVLILLFISKILTSIKVPRRFHCY